MRPEKGYITIHVYLPGYFSMEGLYLEWFQELRESTEDKDWSNKPFGL